MSVCITEAIDVQNILSLTHTYPQPVTLRGARTLQLVSGGESVSVRGDDFPDRAGEALYDGAGGEELLPGLDLLGVEHEALALVVLRRGKGGERCA